MAPGLIGCVDADDLSRALGTASQPTRMGWGVYLQSSKMFVPATEDVARCLGECQTLVAMPATDNRASTLVQLGAALRSWMPGSVELVLVAPYDLTIAAGQTSLEVVPVALVLRSAALVDPRAS